MAVIEGVCGNASDMAVAVDGALLAIVETAGGKSHDAAEAYLDDLKKSHRYLRDVY